MKQRKLRKDEFAAAWSEPETESERAFVLILRTSGCAWAAKAGCLMCGYTSDSLPGVGQTDINSQVAKALARYSGEPVVKIYTSGSFLDRQEIPEPTKVLDVFVDAGARSFVIESRPEFVKQAREMIASYGARIQVAIGLETASDSVRGACVGKGFSFEQYTDAVAIIRDAGATVRTYLLLKPPFLNERDAIEDALASVRIAGQYSDVVSINPVNVQARTAVERLWRRGEYRPPWLWSLVEVLRVANGSRYRIVSSPSGGGTPRGAHNCGRCDKSVLEAVSRFSISRDTGALSVQDCDCVERWRDLVAIEPFAMTTVDLERVSRLD